MNIIKIDAMWCPSCLVMSSRLNKLLKEFDYNLINLDYDIDKDIISNYNVGDILPVIIITNNNKEIDRLVGEVSTKKLKEFLTR